VDYRAPGLRLGKLAPLVVGAMLAACLLAPGAALAAFPGANGKIVFSSTRDDPNPTTCDPFFCNWELYTINPDGTGATRITNTPEPEVNPRWSQDGQRIVFQRGTIAPSEDIYVVNADGSNYSLVIAKGEQPAFSPAGNRIVFRRDPNDPNQGMNTVNVDGTGLLRIFVRGEDPAWSPDGSKIAFQETCCGGPSIQTMNPDGSGIAFVTGGSQAGHDHPDWSPDGSKIAFEVGLDSTEPTGIFVINKDGTAESFVRTGEHPAWSPDGTKIAFQGQDDFQGDIAVMNANGTAAVNITNSPAREQHPDWQPLRALSPFPRPGGGSPLLTYLVPAFDQCVSPNTQHVGPLAQGSCTPPVQTSDLLTTSKIGQGTGFVRLDVQPGNPATSADEADVKLEADISDVRNSSDQSDYSGQVLVSSVLRITDRASGFGGVSATTSDFRFDVPVSCTPTAVAPNGSDCQLLTTADSLVPGMIAESKRTIVATQNWNVLDAGLDGSVSAPSCPPTCGTGDEQRYLEQGTFTP
jgi:Tol biopolymer transport system component